MSTKIEWTGKTLGALVGCSRKSPGCAHCYAESNVRRFEGMHYQGRDHLEFGPEKARIY